jgi:hypothetical protein
LECLQEPSRKAGTTSKICHAVKAAKARDRHNTSNDRDPDACKVTAFAEIVEIVIVEEKLRTDIVSTRFNFCFQVVHFTKSVGGRRVAFGESGDTDAEAATITGMGKCANRPDEIGSLREGASDSVSILWHITAQGEQIAHPGGQRNAR